jgi:hypothetical protein
MSFNYIRRHKEGRTKLFPLFFVLSSVADPDDLYLDGDPDPTFEITRVRIWFRIQPSINIGQAFYTKKLLIKMANETYLLTEKLTLMLYMYSIYTFVYTKKILYYCMCIFLS